MQNEYREPEKTNSVEILDNSGQDIESRFEEIFGDFSRLNGEKLHRQREFIKKSRNLKRV